MSTKLAIWLHVTPPPATLAECSAIYQALCKQGRVSVFAKCEDSDHEQVNKSHGSSSTFYAVFPLKPPTHRPTFTVPVYHGIPKARLEDPFNIRGLQNRKPMPAPKTFTCSIDAVSRRFANDRAPDIVKRNPYHGHFAVEEESWLEDVLVEMNAPPGIARGCAVRKQDEGGTMPAQESGEKEQKEVAQRRRVRKINMESLMDMWHEATNSTKHNDIRKESSEKSMDSGGGTAKRILLNVDTPLGRS